MQAQVIRNKHYTEQVRIFGAMTEAAYVQFSIRLKQLIEIENAGMKPCACNKCNGKCPGKFSGSSSQLVCYDCTFGKHRGMSLSPRPDTSSTEQRHGSPAVKRKIILRRKR